MILKHRLYILFLFLIQGANILAQDFDGIPPSLIYKQIETDSLRIIYPEGMYPQAVRIANTINYMDANLRQSIGDKQRKLNIVLQNQLVQSNGFVQLAPFRSNYFTTPMQQSNELGSLPWLDLLSMHEYRHAMQFSNTLYGFSKFMYLMGGQTGWTLAANLAIPDWFWEGDAVVNETALSIQGRGRIPEFYTGYKSLEYAGKRYRYIKARNGSYKDMVPDHYKHGYLMCNYARDIYGNDFWKKILKESSAYKGILFPFNKSLKRNAGLKSKTLFNKSLDYYRKQWEEDWQPASLTKADTINKKHKTVTNYTYSYFYGNNIICNRAGFNEIASFILTDLNGNEKKVVLPGLRHDDHFSFNGKSLCWTELRYDPRWDLRNYSVIVKYDIASRKKTVLTPKSKLFAPDISPDNSKIAAVEVDEEGNCNVVVINAEDGSRIKEFKNDSRLFYTYPKWSVDGRYIYSSCRNLNGEMGIVRIESETASADTVLHFINHIIGNVFTAKKHIYFQASFSGTDNIYSLDPDNETLLQLTNVPVGAYNPAVSANEDSLIYSEVTYRGNNLKLLKLKPSEAKNIDIKPLHTMNRFKTIANIEEGGNILDRIPPRKYEEKDYPRNSHLLNIHTWNFLFTDPAIGISLISTNVLNTFICTTSVKKNLNENADIYNLNLAYGGFYPILKAEVEYGKNRYDNKNFYHWNEISGKAFAELPFNLSKNLFNRGLSISNGILTSKVNYAESISSVPLNDYSIASYEGRIVFRNIRKSAYQNIYSHLAQRLEVKYRKSLSAYSGEQLYANFNNALRGIGKNHNVVLQFSSMYQPVSNDYKYMNDFIYPRGYSKFSADRIYRISFNYHLPLLYPDRGINGLIYFKRIRGNIFYDYSIAQRNSVSRNFNSYGAELIFDAELFNSIPYQFGMRYSVLGNKDPDPAKGNSVFEMFVPVVLF